MEAAADFFFGAFFVVTGGSSIWGRMRGRELPVAARVVGILGGYMEVRGIGEEVGWWCSGFREKSGVDVEMFLRERERNCADGRLLGSDIQFFF